MNKFSGACHCKQVKFEVETDLSDPARCNCSFCIRRGSLLQRVPAAAFSLLEGENELTRYGSRSFSKHFFCKHCGVHPFTRSTRHDCDEVIINVNCLADVDMSSINPRWFDGANLL